MVASIQSMKRAAVTAPRWYQRLPVSYVVAATAIAAGWLSRDAAWINPEHGLGYWLGIAGGSLMLILLLYPLRKRWRFMHRLGKTRYWFSMHMVFGLYGPLLVLYHCNFQLGSLNSRVALFCMLLVAGSGIIGRHFYARIHRGLYGRRTSLRELQAELDASLEDNAGLARLLPQLSASLRAIGTELQGDAVTQSLGFSRGMRWTLTHRFTRWSLTRAANRELATAATQSPAVSRDLPRLRRTASRYVADYTGLMGRVAQFSFYERLFALWHVFHMPIFFLMIFSALFHVLAVHMY